MTKEAEFKQAHDRLVEAHERRLEALQGFDDAPDMAQLNRCGKAAQKAAAALSECLHDMPGDGGPWGALSDDVETLKQALDVLRRIEWIEGARGRPASDDRLLADHVALLYRRTFGEWPSTAENGHARRLLRKIDSPLQSLPRKPT